MPIPPQQQTEGDFTIEDVQRDLDSLRQNLETLEREAPRAAASEPFSVNNLLPAVFQSSVILQRVVMMVDSVAQDVMERLDSFEDVLEGADLEEGGSGIPISGGVALQVANWLAQQNHIAEYQHFEAFLAQKRIKMPEELYNLISPLFLQHDDPQSKMLGLMLKAEVEDRSIEEVLAELQQFSQADLQAPLPQQEPLPQQPPQHYQQAPPAPPQRQRRGRGSEVQQGEQYMVLGDNAGQAVQGYRPGSGPVVTPPPRQQQRNPQTPRRQQQVIEPPSGDVFVRSPSSLPLYQNQEQSSQPFPSQPLPIPPGWTPPQNQQVAPRQTPQQAPQQPQQEQTPPPQQQEQTPPPQQQQEEQEQAPPPPPQQYLPPLTMIREYPDEEPQEIPEGPPPVTTGERLADYRPQEPPTTTGKQRQIGPPTTSGGAALSNMDQGMEQYVPMPQPPPPPDTTGDKGKLPPTMLQNTTGGPPTTTSGVSAPAPPPASPAPETVSSSPKEEAKETFPEDVNQEEVESQDSSESSESSGEEQDG